MEDLLEYKTSVFSMCNTNTCVLYQCFRVKTCSRPLSPIAKWHFGKDRQWTQPKLYQIFLQNYFN